jgi:hypothetical protein
MAFMARLRNWCGRITARIADAIHVMAAARAAEVKTRRGGFGGRSGSTRPKPPSRRRNRDLAADESSSCRAESSKRNGGHSRETRNRIRVNTVSIDSIAVEHGSDDDPVNGAGL